MSGRLIALVTVLAALGAAPALAQADATITCTGSGHTAPITVTSTTATTLGPGFGTCALSGVIPAGAVVNDLIVAITAGAGSGNAGTINFLSDDPGSGGNESLVVTSGTFTNSGTIDDKADKYLQELGGNILNTGTIEDTGGGTSELWADDGSTPGTLENASGGTISIAGGSFEVKPPVSLKLDSGSTTSIATSALGYVVGAPLEVAGGTLAGTLGFPNGGTLTYDGGASASTGSLLVSSPVTLSGTIPAGWTVNVQAGTLSPQAGAANDGTVLLSGGAPTITATGTFTNAGTISDATSSRAFINAPTLVNSGRLSLTAASILELTGNLQLTASSALSDTVAGTSAGNSFGLFEVSGAATLGGSFSAQLGSGYSPSVGDAQQFLTGGSVGGTFASTTLPSATSAVTFSLRYAAASASLVASATSINTTTTPTTPTGSTSPTGSAITVVPIAPTILLAKINHRRHTAAFEFKAADATSYACALVTAHKHRGKLVPHFTACASSRTYQHLKTGSYTFEVRASDSVGTGAVDKRHFTI